MTVKKNLNFNFLMTMVGVSLVHMMFMSGCSPVAFNKVETKPPTDQCPAGTTCFNPGSTKKMTYSVTFDQSNKVDILVVVDNSGSMETEQRNLSTPFNGFIANLNQYYSQVSGGYLDWQIGVINTDICNSSDCNGNFFEAGMGRFMNQLYQTPAYGNFTMNRNTPNIANVFANTVQRGSQVGHGDERPIAAAIMALNTNPYFFRQNSNLAVVILSDEDERSVGGSDPNDRDYKPLEEQDRPEGFISRVSSRWPGKSVRVNSIIVKPGDTACLNQQRGQGPYFTGHYGNTLARFSNLTGGTIGSICDNGSGSFSAMLSNITGAIVNQPNSNTVTLPKIPTVRPTATWNIAANQRSFTWNPGSNQIVFSQRPPAGTTVTFEITYKDEDQKLNLKPSLVANPEFIDELPVGRD